MYGIKNIAADILAGYLPLLPSVSRWRSEFVKRHHGDSFRGVIWLLFFFLIPIPVGIVIALLIEDLGRFNGNMIEVVRYWMS